MPQFDFFSFFVQIFWVTVGFFVLYLTYLKYFLKTLSEVIKWRKKINSLLTSVNKRKINSSFIYDEALKFALKK